MGTCPLADASTQRPSGTIALLDMKLNKLQAALEKRLQESDPQKVSVMRHLTQLKYQIGTAKKWNPADPEAACLSDRVVSKVKELVASARLHAPTVYIFSKRVENVIVQKERAFRKLVAQSTALSPQSNVPFSLAGSVKSLVTEVNSCVSANSATGTETEMESCSTISEGTAFDVGNMHEASEMLETRSEVEQRHWFYKQCLRARVTSGCSDKSLIKNPLIADLYTKVRSEQVPIKDWVPWIHRQVTLNDPGAASVSLRERQRKLSTVTQQQTVLKPSDFAVPSSRLEN